MGNERARPAGLRQGAVVPRDVDHHRDARRVVHRAFEEGATGAEMRPLDDGDSVIGNTLLSGRVSPPAVNSADHAVGYHNGFIAISWRQARTVVSSVQVRSRLNEHADRKRNLGVISARPFRSPTSSSLDSTQHAGALPSTTSELY
jgi:hypothetical protein